MKKATLKPKSPEQFTTRAKVLKAMAHPSRLLVLDELSSGERCVCQLVELIGADFSTVSKHLTVLKEAGLVEDDKRGQQVFYTLKVPCVMEFMECIEAVIKRGCSCRK